MLWNMSIFDPTESTQHLQHATEAHHMLQHSIEHEPSSAISINYGTREQSHAKLARLLPTTCRQCDSQDIG